MCIRDRGEINYDQFMELFQNRLISQTSNQLKGFDAFPQRHVQTGVDQYIQTLIMLHGIDGLSIFEHDYYWYKMVYPNIKFSTWDTLTPERPVLMAMPFPGYLDEHPYLQCILDICDERGIDVVPRLNRLGEGPGIGCTILIQEEAPRVGGSVGQ